MNKPTAAISPSRANDFKQCPLKFRFRTVDKLPEPPGKEALRGTIVHSVLEYLFQLPKSERTPENAQSLLIPRWEAQLGDKPELEELFTSQEELTRWLESARPLLNNYFQLENPAVIEPAGQEIFINTQLPSGLAIRGIVDRIDKNNAGELRIIDYKTGKAPAPRFQQEAVFQLLFYVAAIYFRDGTMPLRAQLLYLKNTRTITYDPAPTDINFFQKTLDSLWREIINCLDARYFAPHTGPLCSWCHFQPFCPAFGGNLPSWDEEKATYLRSAQA